MCSFTSLNFWLSPVDGCFAGGLQSREGLTTRFLRNHSFSAVNYR